MNKLVFRYPREKERENLPFYKQDYLIANVQGTDYLIDCDLYFCHSGAIYHIEYQYDSRYETGGTSLVVSRELGQIDRDLVDCVIEESKYTIEGEDLQDLVSYIVTEMETLEKAMSNYDEEDEDEDDDF